MICHDLQRPCARAFVYVRVCLLAMVFAIVFAVALAAPSAVAQTTTPQYLFLTTGVPERPPVSGSNAIRSSPSPASSW